MSAFKKSIVILVHLFVFLACTNISYANSIFGGADDIFNSNIFGNQTQNVWVSAEKIGSEPRGYIYAICYYKTSSYSSFPNHRFSITIQGSEYTCPYFIQFNPLTNAWKK